MSSLPRIIVEVVQGIVVAVYALERGALYAVVDSDQAEVGQDSVGLDYTWSRDEVPEEIAEAIRAVLPEEEEADE